MSVVLVGGSGWGNLGDDLIAREIVHALPPEDRGAVVLVGGGLSLKADIQFVRRVSLSGKLRERLRLLYEIARAREVIIGGGGLLDDRLPDFYRPFTRIAQWSALVGTPYRFLGIGVGPVRRPSTGSNYLKALKGASAVSVRDHASAQRLAGIGFRGAVEVVDDPALWRKRSVTTTRPRFDICINLRCWASEGSSMPSYDGASIERILDVVAYAVRRVHGRGARIALVSMSELRGDQDSVILNRLVRLLDGDIEVFAGVPVETVERVIASSSSALGMRLHFLLIAYLHGVRPIGLSYDPKVTQQAEKLGFAAMELDDDLAGEALALRLRG
ncbi:polysaccharide pyruvyl transferase family protein [Sinomonas sp. R1AF57]|uniref:polysaccharide pyruvyl transferase family protein n=1 Tax=Sinomonas sp. R1AF57 TaxID=2020377 RepID=UPI001ABF713D